MMPLSDLPLELLVEALQIRDCLLEILNETIIPLLNFLLLRELSKIMAECGLVKLVITTVKW